MEAYLARHAKDVDLAISDERAGLLETGGGLVYARDLLGEAPFITLNSDNLWADGPIDAVTQLAARWDDTRMDALLMLVPLARANGHPGRGDFKLDPKGKITERRKPGRLAPFVYTGMQILSPRVFRDCPEGPFSTNVFWNRALAEGRLWGVVYQGRWFEVGSPEAIAEAEAALADG